MTRTLHRILTGAALGAAFCGPALADGTEALGAPTIAFAETGEVLLAGVGLVDSQPASFSVAVPAGRSVKQVVAYWDGLDFPGSSQGATDTITVNGLSVTGARIGGASNFYTQYWVSAYRADLTELALVGAGESLVTVGGLDYTYANNGLALVVVLEDEERALQVVDGLDYAYALFPAPFDRVAPVIYTLEPAGEDRAASVDLLVGGVAANRPSVVEVRVDGLVVVEAIDVLGNGLGAELDALSLDFVVPAGASQVSVEILSEDRGGAFAGLQEASLTWLFSGLNVDAPAGGSYGCEPLWWLCNWWRWDPWCRDDNLTATFDFQDRFNETFGVTSWRSGLSGYASLGGGLVGGGCWSGFWLTLLNREAVAALLNADAALGYPYSVEEVRAIYRDAVGAAAGPHSLWSALCLFHQSNRLGCPPL